MEKKRREKNNFREVDLTNQNLTLKTYLSSEVSRNEHCGLQKVAYKVLPNHGSGSITEYSFDGVTISISNFVFNSNFIFFNEVEVNALYLSFLIKGEMLIQSNNHLKEQPYQANESFMAYINRFNGGIKVYKNSPFKEIKVIVSNNFLLKHGLNDVSEFKNITDTNLIIPISHNILDAVTALEARYGEGFVQRLYLGAKVIELIALQFENYKALKTKGGNFSNQKSLKKLFVLKQFLKDNLNQNYALIELANEVGLSENVLKSEFKRIFNCTVNQYFTEEKMKHAKNLLQQTKLPIYEIAEEVGYKNATHFTAAFKRFYNQTPKVCRGKI